MRDDVLHTCKHMNHRQTTFVCGLKWTERAPTVCKGRNAATARDFSSFLLTNLHN